MKRRVTVGGEEREVELPEGATAGELVAALELHPDGVLVLAEEIGRASCRERV